MTKGGALARKVKGERAAASSGGEAALQLGEFAVAAMIAGVGDERGGLVGLGLRLGASGFGAGEGGGNVEGDWGALEREVGEVEPHFVVGDQIIGS